MRNTRIVENLKVFLTNFVLIKYFSGIKNIYLELELLNKLNSI